MWPGMTPSLITQSGHGNEDEEGAGSQSFRCRDLAIWTQEYGDGERQKLGQINFMRNFNNFENFSIFIDFIADQIFNRKS